MARHRHRVEEGLCIRCQRAASPAQSTQDFDAFSKASGVRVDNRSDNVGEVVGSSGNGVPVGGGIAAALPALTLLPGAMLFWAATISGGESFQRGCF